MQPEQRVEFGCGDLAVVGRIRTVGQTPVQGTDPLPNWRSAYRLQIQIKRIVRDVERRCIVSAIAVAHVQIRDDRDFLIVLTPDGTGEYSLAAASSWRHQPRLSRSCS